MPDYAIVLLYVPVVDSMQLSESPVLRPDAMEPVAFQMSRVMDALVKDPEGNSFHEYQCEYPRATLKRLEDHPR